MAGAMSDSCGTYQRASVLEAAAILGVSPTTIRRMVRAGTLQAERVLRPQGHTFVVLVPTSSQPGAGQQPQVSATARTEQPQAEAMVSLIQATIATVLGPLVGQLDAQRQTIERQADELKAMARENGRLTERLEALTASHGPGASNLTPETPDPSPELRDPFPWPIPPHPNLRALAPWVLLAVILLLAAAVGQPAWVR